MWVQFWNMLDHRSLGKVWDGNWFVCVIILPFKCIVLIKFETGKKGKTLLEAYEQLESISSEPNYENISEWWVIIRINAWKQIWTQKKYPKTRYLYR